MLSSCSSMEEYAVTDAAHILRSPIRDMVDCTPELPSSPLVEGYIWKDLSNSRESVESMPSLSRSAFLPAETTISYESSQHLIW